LCVPEYAAVINSRHTPLLSTELRSMEWKPLTKQELTNIFHVQANITAPNS
jgi:hypothetical protein